MDFGTYELISAAVVLVTLLGIRLLSSPRTSVAGNRLGALAMLFAIAAVLLHNDIIDMPLLIAGLLVGSVIGAALSVRVTMLKIPQFVALLNGLGGLASLLVALVVLFEQYDRLDGVNLLAGQLAIIVGGVTFSGSLVAAGKLDKRISQQPLVMRGHSALSLQLIIVMAVLAAAGPFEGRGESIVIAVAAALVSLAFGAIFAVRIGGADMPITISLLNSYSGLAASICGFAVNDYMLIAIGAIVGAAGLILTRIMCRAMNRSLMDILTGRTSYAKGTSAVASAPEECVGTGTLPRTQESVEERLSRIARTLDGADRVIFVPGYGMALSQAQGKVKELFDLLVGRGKDVRFAIHPVAGRMPGHMNVLLAEVDVPYDRLYELEDINPEFASTDVAVIVGACDVVNPSAITAEGTPIYGMPILLVHEAKNVVVCNLDTKPGYSGVDNPLYGRENTILMLGNAEETLTSIIGKM